MSTEAVEFDADYVAGLRAESARYQEELATAEAELAGRRQVLDDLAAARELRTRLEDEAARDRIAAQHGLAPELAERLRGDSSEELEADAQRLAAELNPEWDDADFDPVEMAAATRRGLR